MLIPMLGVAQSDLPADTTTIQEDYEPEEDTSYTTTEKAPDTVIYRSTPDSVITRLQQSKEFAYANDSAYWKKEVEEPPKESILMMVLFSAAFQIFLLILFVVVVMYFLLKVLTENKIILFRRKKKMTTATGEDEEAMLHQDLSSLIASAEQNNQFRLAARYRYMQLLQQMDSRELIRMQAELTNWDYVRQMGAHPLNEKFRYLTYAYEYVWYGEFELNSDQYGFLRKKFETFLN
jgi:hypothetical protein